MHRQIRRIILSQTKTLAKKPTPPSDCSVPGFLWNRFNLQIHIFHEHPDMGVSFLRGPSKLVVLLLASFNTKQTHMASLFLLVFLQITLAQSGPSRLSSSHGGQQVLPQDLC